MVSLLAVEETPEPAFSVVAAGLAGTLGLVQALGDAGVEAPLWVLTRGAVAAGAGEVLASPAQAQAWGLGRAAALEHPDRWGGLIDLPPVLDERAAARLAAVLAGCGEDQVAIRPAGILGRRLARAPQPRGDGSTWAPRRDRADHRGDRGDRRARGPLAGRERRAAGGAGRPVRPGRARRGGAGRRARGPRCATPRWSPATSRNGRRSPRCSARIGAAGPPLTAVLHTAGVLDDGVLDRLDTARLAAVLAGKAAAAAHLDELTADLGPGRVRAVLLGGGRPGQRRAGQLRGGERVPGRAGPAARGPAGLAALSVAWGPWAGGGVAQASAAVQQRLRRGPLPEMDPGLAVKALGQALAGADAVLAVMDVDWAQFIGADQVPFFRDLPEIRQPASGPGTGQRTARAPGQQPSLPKGSWPAGSPPCQRPSRPGC